MGLNKNCKDPAYLLGRLFAVLEFVQKDANPGITSTIRDRYLIPPARLQHQFFLS